MWSVWSAIPSDFCVSATGTAALAAATLAHTATRTAAARAAATSAASYIPHTSTIHAPAHAALQRADVPNGARKPTRTPTPSHRALLAPEARALPARRRTRARWSPTQRSPRPSASSRPT